MRARGGRRLAILIGLVACFAAAIGARLVDVQIFDADDYRARAIDQRVSRMEIPATRGAIVDRQGHELAVSMEARALYAHPRRVADPRRAAELLAPVVGRPPSAILALLRSDAPFVYLHRSLEPEAAERIAALDLQVGGNGAFGLEPVPKRVYPHGPLGVHVVGYATIDGDGVEGIEARYDETLKGDPTVYLVLRDARAGRTREKIADPRKHPSDVVLTLDMTLQYVVERELDTVMRESGARAASAILLDPANGQVLALANRPAADPNAFGRATDAERRNRAVADFYEPGSTFKIVTMAAALERGRIRSNQLIDCERGVYHLASRTIHDVSANGLLTPLQILEKSSNIGMVKIVQSLTPRELWESISRFGFGAPTGIELPGEHPGRLLEPPQWSGYSRESLAFGHEIGVTALQMATAMATIANQGVAVAPRVVLGARLADGRFEAAPPAEARRVLDSRTAREISAMLEAVIDVGTGRRAAVDGFRLAGKSGTAQKAVRGGYSETEYVASFGGFGPVDEPRVVCLVVVDTPRFGVHHGGQVAAPVFRRIMADALRHLRVPTDPSWSENAARRSDAVARVEEPAPPRERVETVAGTVPDVRGLSLREAVQACTARGYRVVVDGRGRVAEQAPAPGSPLEAGRPCALRLSDEGRT